MKRRLKKILFAESAKFSQTLEYISQQSTLPEILLDFVDKIVEGCRRGLVAVSLAKIPSGELSVSDSWSMALVRRFGRRHRFS